MTDSDLTWEDAMPLLAVRVEDDGTVVVHTYLQSRSGMLLGADWAVDGLRSEAVRHRITRSGPSATAMGHGLVIVRPERDGGSVFIETRP